MWWRVIPGSNFGVEEATQECYSMQSTVNMTQSKMFLLPNSQVAVIGIQNIRIQGGIVHWHAAVPDMPLANRQRTLRQSKIQKSACGSNEESQAPLPLLSNRKDPLLVSCINVAASSRNQPFTSLIHSTTPEPLTALLLATPLMLTPGHISGGSHESKSFALGDRPIVR